MTKCSNGSSRKNPVPKNRPTTLRTRISICSWCATDETFTKYQNSPATIDLQDRILHALEKKDALNAGMFGVGTNPLVQADAIRSKDLRALREGFASALKSSNAMVRAAVIMNPLVTVANLRLMMSDKDEVASFVLGASGRFENPEDIVKMANSTNY